MSGHESYIQLAEPRPCEDCGTATDRLDVDFGVVLCGPCNARITDEWVFATYTHCGKCGREFTEGTLQLGAITRRWRYCLWCNYRGPTVVEPTVTVAGEPPVLPEPRRTPMGFVKGSRT